MTLVSKTAAHPEAKILIVDDENGNIKVLERMLRSVGYKNIATTTDGRIAPDLYQTFHPDLILLDIKMPRFSGFDVINTLREIEQNTYLPILVLTAQYDHEVRIRALESGAKDFVSKPFEASEILARIHNILEVRLLHNSIKEEKIHLEDKVQERTQELQKSRIEVIHRLGRAAEFRDNETGMHVVRMSKYSEMVGRGIGLDDKTCRLILNASPMHDIGKIGIPDYILLKPGPLTPEEWTIMKSHTEIGALLLSGSDSDILQLAEVIALSHHEKWDGTGYPRGLKGEEIPLEARIVTMCDIFDALTSERPYKKSWPVEDAINELINIKGKILDPDLVDCFVDKISQILEISLKFSDSEDELAELQEFSKKHALSLKIQKLS